VPVLSAVPPHPDSCQNHEFPPRLVGLKTRTAQTAPPPFADCARAFESELDFVFRTLRRLGVRGSDTEDLAQEVFLVVWRRWGEYDPTRSLRAWLAGIAVKVASSHHRRRPRRELPRIDVEATDHLPGPEDQLASSRTRALVLRGLDALSEKYRTVLVLHDLNELAVRDIAVALELPLFTVHTRLRRARLKLAKWLAEQEAPLAAGGLLALEGRLLPAPAPVPVHRARLRAVALVLGVAALAAGLAMLAVGGLRTARRTERAAATTPAAPLALDQGLLGHWSFDDGAGALARDRSAAANHCLLRQLDPAAAWVTGAHGGAIDLGTSGWLECPQPTARAGGQVTLSVSAWVKRARSKPGAVIASRHLGPSTENFFHFSFAEDQLRVWGHSWRGWTAHELRALESDWIHVAFTHAGPRSRLFVDGRLVAHDDDHGVRGIGTASGPLIIGGAQHGAGIWQHFDGAIDEVRIYGRALSDAEIAALSRR